MVFYRHVAEAKCYQIYAPIKALGGPHHHCVRV